ncbi:MAG: putative porin [Verrucomicrobia bacterium]|nr:putative porin [Kiritimatiellia bacterium]MCP5488832.1 putative porin [Verrucomicrobiota bacterium]
MKKILMTMTAGLMLANLALAEESAKPSWTDTIKLKGDVRFRLEQIDDATKSETRERARIRARLAAEAKVNDEIKAAIGLASGGDDPVSSNQTLSDGFSTKDIRLDLAYLTYSPEAADGLNLTLGKMKKPWTMVNDLVWDGDLNPEGAALNYKLGLDGMALLLNAGAFAVEERSSTDDTMLYSGQAAVEVKQDNMTVLIGGSLYYYDNIEGFAPVYDDGDAFGNSTITVGEEDDESILYANGFEIMEGFAKVSLDLGMPVSMFGNYVVNNDADDYDTGYLFGFSVGKAKELGTFDFSYDYRELEKNAVVGAFADSDSFGGGTDGRGHRLALGIGLAKNLSGKITYFIDETGISGSAEDYNRLQIDLVGKF